MTEIERDVVFGTAGHGGRDLRCDVYRPDPARANSTAVLLLHGGGWRAGDRVAMEPHGRALAAAGYLCVSSEYRLNGEARWPAHIHDAKAAIRWIRAQAGALGVDPAKVVAVGSSAGAHLALLAAGTPDDPAFEGDGGNAGAGTALAAVAAFYPPVRFYRQSDGRASGASPASALMGDDADDPVLRAAAPIEHVTAAYPPTCLLHGTADTVVPVSASMRMFEALTASKVPVDLHVYGEQPHGFARLPSVFAAAIADVTMFFDRRVADPDRFAREEQERAAAMAPSPAAT